MTRITKAQYGESTLLQTVGYIGPWGCIGTEREEIILDTEDGLFLATRWELEKAGMEVEGFLVRLPEYLDQLIGKPEYPNA